MKRLITSWSRSPNLTADERRLLHATHVADLAVDISVGLDSFPFSVRCESGASAQVPGECPEHLEFEVLLDPGFPCLGGMEVLASIKQTLLRELHQDNIGCAADGSFAH